MDRHRLALTLSEIGTLLDLKGENPFKARAFHTAARSVEKLETDPVALVRAGRLEEVRGVGPATARVIRDLVETGTSRYYDELRAATPAGLRELLAVPGLGPRKVHQLYVQLGVSSIADLERAAREGRISGLRGFGERMQEKLATGVRFVRGTSGRRRLWQALEPAHRVVAWLTSLAAVGRVELAGEVRRHMETVDGVDVLAAAELADHAAILDAFARLPGVATADEQGPDRARVRLADGMELRLRCVAPEDFAAAWLVETGSPDHLAELLARAAALGVALDVHGVTRNGVRLTAQDESRLYAALELPWIAPELREGCGEVVAAAAGSLPRLVTMGDVRGCFHCHTTYSDGKATIPEMAEAAALLGWRYLGIADHSQAAAYAGGLSRDAIVRQHEEIDLWNQRHGNRVWLFKGIEADILADGTVDYADAGDAVLATFDFVIGSVHSSFGMPQARMTRRVLRALENPYLTMLGHPTGRLLLSRDAYAIDLDAVIEAAGERGRIIEINADPHRLDMDWRYWPRAKQAGVLCALNPDAHSTRALEYVGLGVLMARKGWLEPMDIVNTWTLERVRSHLAERS